MDCGYFENLIEKMPDEPLSPEESAALQEHLSRCAACRALQEAYAFLSLELTDPEDAPEDLADNVMNAVWAENRKQVKRTKRRRMTGWVTAAACVALAVGVGFPMFSAKGGSSADLAAPAAMEYAAAPRAVAEEAPAEAVGAGPVAESRAVVTAEAPTEPEIPSLTPPDEVPGEGPPRAEEESAAVQPEGMPAAGALLPAEDSLATAARESRNSAAPEAPDTAHAEPGEVSLTAPGQEAQSVKSLLELLCVPGGEDLPLEDFEMQYSFAHNGTVYEFLLWNGQVWWRSDSESIPILSPAGEAELFALIQ